MACNWVAGHFLIESGIAAHIRSAIQKSTGCRIKACPGPDPGAGMTGFGYLAVGLIRSFLLSDKVAHYKFGNEFIF